MMDSVAPLEPQNGSKLVYILSHHRAIAVICILFVTVAFAYGLVMPPFENLDEIEHFSAIRYVAETGSLPVHDPEIQARYHYRQEASQPPLYYILMGGLTRLLRLPTDDTNSYLVSNPFVACGPSDQPYNKHTLYHNPSREAFSLDKLGNRSWDGALLTLHILRAVATLFGVITVVCVYAIARLVFPQYPQVAPLAAAFTAFNPQFVSVASGVNNDNLVTPLATVGLYLTLVARQHGFSFPRSLGLGILAGLAGLSKLSGLLLLGLIGMVLLERAWRSSRWRWHIRHGTLIAAVAAIVCGWWFWRNWQLYGDPTALEPMLKLVGRRESPIFPLHESGLMFRSYWGQIACAFFSDGFYLFFSSLTALGLLGLLLGAVRSWQRGWQDRRNWTGMLWLALWFGLILVGWLRWDWLTPAPGGRLLFPAIASTSVLLAYGLVNLWPTAWRGRVAAVGVLLLAAVAVATLRWELYPLFVAPRTYDSADNLVILYPLEATFGSTTAAGAPSIALLGYDAKITGDRPPYLDATFYWQARTSITQDYALAIQLTSPVPGDDSLRFNYNTWPGRGNFPTTAWLPAQIIADHYRFRLPASDAVTQAWQLLVAFYETGSGDRLPVRIDAQDVGKGLVLTTLRVPGLRSDCPQETVLDQPVNFGQMISLTGAMVRPGSGNSNPGLQVSLCWESLAPAPLDYTVFVHLYSESGKLVATGDGPPMGGAFPSGLWQPGDAIADVHFVPVTDMGLLTTGSYRVGIGLYDLNTGDRVPAVQEGQPLLNNTVLLNAKP